jgi:hypothetical protein
LRAREKWMMAPVRDMMREIDLFSRQRKIGRGYESEELIHTWMSEAWEEMC